MAQQISSDQQEFLFRLAEVEGMSKADVTRVVELSPKLNHPETLTQEEVKFLCKAMDVYIADLDTLGKKLAEVTLKKGLG